MVLPALGVQPRNPAEEPHRVLGIRYVVMERLFLGHRERRNAGRGAGNPPAASRAKVLRLMGEPSARLPRSISSLRFCREFAGNIAPAQVMRNSQLRGRRGRRRGSVSRALCGNFSSVRRSRGGKAMASAVERPAWTYHPVVRGRRCDYGSPGLHRMFVNALNLAEQHLRSEARIVPMLYFMGSGGEAVLRLDLTPEAESDPRCATRRV